MRKPGTGQGLGGYSKPSAECGSKGGVNPSFVQVWVGLTGEAQITLLFPLHSVYSRTRQDLSLCFWTFSQVPPGSALGFHSMDSDDTFPSAHLSHCLHCSSLSPQCSLWLCQDIGKVRFFSLTGTLLKISPEGISLNLTQHRSSR